MALSGNLYLEENPPVVFSSAGMNPSFHHLISPMPVDKDALHEQTLDRLSGAQLDPTLKHGP